MSDLEKTARELGTKTAFAAAKDAAERALEDAMLTEEERVRRRAEQDALARRTRNKRIVQIAIGSLLVIGVIGLLLHYWYWALLLGLVGATGLYGRHRWRKRRAARPKSEPAALEAPRVRVEPAAPPVEEADASVEDELAALKARVKR